VTACADLPGRLRFHNQPAHWRVQDRVPIARPRALPVERFDPDMWFYRPVDYVLDVPDPHPAENVNALGEVPDSTWFTNRIGVRDLTPAEIGRGPNRDFGPAPPLRIRKLAEDRQGLRVKDAHGSTFLLELDPPRLPEMTSGADIVVQRLLWAVGYHVPEDSIAYLRRDELVIDADSMRETDDGEVPFTEADLDGWLAGQPRTPEGRVRALASKFVPGEPVGPYSPDGRRRDDPNDRVRHEHRRDLRGQFVFFAWLANTDLNPSNRLDMWVEDPHRPGQGHVVHWLIDFDRALGAISTTNDVPWDGYSYTIDYGLVLASTLGLGLWERPWERAKDPGLPGVGRFESEHFSLARFRPRHWHGPFLYRDDFDDFWATKILMRLRPEHIRAAVGAARYTDPRASAYLVRTLLARQRTIGRQVFTKVNPLDGLRVVTRGADTALCADDLLLHHGLGDAAIETRYEARAYDWHGRLLPWRGRAGPGRDGSFCLDRLRSGRARHDYTIVEIRTRRGPRKYAPVLVHLARDPGSGRLRVIGIDRRRR